MNNNNFTRENSVKMNPSNNLTIVEKIDIFINEEYLEYFKNDDDPYYYRDIQQKNTND